MDAVLRASGLGPILGMHDEPYGGAVDLPAMARERAKEEGEEGLKKGIAELYDESSGMWERLWGDHMHHGFYEPGVSVAVADHRMAQVRMIEEALAFAEVEGFVLFAPSIV